MQDFKTYFVFILVSLLVGLIIQFIQLKELKLKGT